MSLDVTLTMPTVVRQHEAVIWVRDNGSTREISRAEWDKRYPGREPVMASPYEDTVVYTANITHNLNIMAEHAGLYKACWRPEEIGITKASQLIEPLSTGLTQLKSKPDYFKQWNPDNGWGDYDGLVSFVEGYLAACQQWPEADVEVSK